MSLPVPIQGQRPQLRVDIPSWTVQLSPPSTSVSPPEHLSSSWSGSSPLSASKQTLLMYTISMLPDYVLSPSSWELHTSDREDSGPATLRYFVPETNITVEVTGYTNGQYVVRLQQNTDGLSHGKPLVAVSIYGRGDGGRMEFPARKVRESLMERVAWNRDLD
jgi:hypothetical protein